MQLISMRRSTVLADVRVGRATRTAVGYSCIDHNKDEIAQDIRNRLKTFMNGFMNDPGHVMGRASWPGADGTPGQAFDSPLAHKKFFESHAGVDGCINEDGMKNILYAIGMTLDICGTSVAGELIKTMNKAGGDDSCTSWPEYLNSMFAVGPVSDSGAPDPTIGADGTVPAIPTEPAAPVDRFAGYTIGGGGPGLGAIGIKEKAPTTPTTPVTIAKAPVAPASSGVGNKAILIGAGIAAAFVAAVVWLRA